MIKTLLGVTAAALLLGGCIAVPVYSEPAPAYGYYGPPPVSLSFGYSGYYGGGRGHGGGRGYRR